MAKRRSSSTYSYSRPTITGGTKTVSYLRNGKPLNKSMGRSQLAGKYLVSGATNGYGTRAYSRGMGKSAGTVHRVVRIKRSSGRERMRMYTVTRNTNARQARRNRVNYMHSQGFDTNATRNRLKIGSGSNVGIRRPHRQTHIGRGGGGGNGGRGGGGGRRSYWARDSRGRFT
jgi:uncharacterized membrane protein